MISSKKKKSPAVWEWKKNFNLEVPMTQANTSSSIQICKDVWYMSVNLSNYCFTGFQRKKAVNPKSVIFKTRLWLAVQGKQGRLQYTSSPCVHVGFKYVLQYKSSGYFVFLVKTQNKENPQIPLCSAGIHLGLLPGQNNQPGLTKWHMNNMPVLSHFGVIKTHCFLSVI